MHRIHLILIFREKKWIQEENESRKKLIQEENESRKKREFLNPLLLLTLVRRDGRIFGSVNLVLSIWFWQLGNDIFVRWQFGNVKLVDNLVSWQFGNVNLVMTIW